MVCRCECDVVNCPQWICPPGAARSMLCRCEQLSATWNSQLQHFPMCLPGCLQDDVSERLWPPTRMLLSTISPTRTNPSEVMTQLTLRRHLLSAEPRHGKRQKRTFLHSALSSQYDRSRRLTHHLLADLFILMPTRLLWKDFSHVARRCPQPTVYSQVLNYTAA